MKTEGEAFSYRTTRDGGLLVYWNGKHVRSYGGHRAAVILAGVEGAESARAVQLVLAKVTGNFKRGNERE